MEDARITEARRLLMEVTSEQRQKVKYEAANQLCKCGHKHKDHTVSYSINYTAGMCTKSGCKCRHFLMNTK